MARAYKEIEKEEVEKTTKTANQQIEARTATVQENIANNDAIVDKATAASVGKYQNQIDDAPATYAEQYDANALADMVNRRKLEENMANMGLTDSGLNRTQQTAMTVQKGNADAATRKQQQAYVDELMKAIADVQTTGEMQKADYANQQNAALDEWSQKLLIEAGNQGRANAATIYNAELEADAAENERFLESKKWKAEYNLKLADQLGMTPEETVAYLNGGETESATSQSAINAALNGITEWDASTGWIFNKTFWSNPTDDGKNVYEDIVFEQLKRNEAYQNLSEENKLRAVAQAVGRSVGITWQSKTESEESKNVDRLTSAAIEALKAVGVEKGDEGYSSALAAFLEEAKTGYYAVR